MAVVQQARCQFLNLVPREKAGKAKKAQPEGFKKLDKTLNIYF